MIILDTTVISELMRGPRADQHVHTWLGRLTQQPVTTVICEAEIRAGIAVLPDGRRRQALAASANAAFSALGMNLPLTHECPAEYAPIVATRRAAGRPIGSMDALIAAIARTASATIATRNTADFSGLGIDLVDPWG